MDLKAIAEGFAKIGLPILGSILPIPGAGAICSALASLVGAPSEKPEDILAHLTQNAEALQRAKEFEAKHEETMLQIKVQAEIAERQADSADLATVNATMQAEAKSEHWLQWAWRPLNGVALAFGSIALVLGVIYFTYRAVAEHDAAALNAIPTIVNATAIALGIPGAVCGVTAWHRGVMQRLQVQADAGLTPDPKRR